MVLYQAKAKIEIREISLKNRPQQLYNISSKGTVPVLQTTENMIIDESLEIMKWVIKKFQLTLIEDNPKKQFQMINNNDKEFKYWLDRYKYFDRFPDKEQKFYRNKGGNYLDSYNDILSENKYLISDSLQLADIAIFPFVRQFTHINKQWVEENFYHLYSWLNVIQLSDMFLSVMEKHETWDTINKGPITNYHID